MLIAPCLDIFIMADMEEVHIGIRPTNGYHITTMFCLYSGVLWVM